MRRRHRATLHVEGLEGRAVLSGITPPVIIGPPPQPSHLVGSASGTCVSSPAGTATSSFQLQGGGSVSPLGAISLQGTITAGGGQLTLRCADKNVTETVNLSGPKVIATGPDFIESFSYMTTDGAYAGTFTLDLYSTTSGGAVPSQFGTFDATFS
jgi:hypothetical protein